MLLMCRLLKLPSYLYCGAADAADGARHAEADAHAAAGGGNPIWHSCNAHSAAAAASGLAGITTSMHYI